MPTHIQRRNIVYGYPTPQSTVQQEPIVMQRDPAVADGAEFGTVWVNTLSSNGFILTSSSTSNGVIAYNWTPIGGGAGTFTSLTVAPGPISLTGTTTINTTGNANTTIGNVAGTGLLSLLGGTAGIQMDGNAASGIDIGESLTTGDIIIGGSAQTGFIDVGSSTAAQSINLGIGASGVKTIGIGNGTTANIVTLGSTTGAAHTIIQAGTAGLQLNAAGDVAMQPATTSGSSLAVTLNSHVGVVTITGLTTAQGAGATIVLTNSTISATSGVFLSIANLNASTNDAAVGISGVQQAAGSMDITFTNNGAGALGAGDNVLLTFWVIS